MEYIPQSYSDQQIYSGREQPQLLSPYPKYRPEYGAHQPSYQQYNQNVLSAPNILPRPSIRRKSQSLALQGSPADSHSGRLSRRLGGQEVAEIAKNLTAEILAELKLDKNHSHHHHHHHHRHRNDALGDHYKSHQVLPNLIKPDQHSRNIPFHLTPQYQLKKYAANGGSTNNAHEVVATTPIPLRDSIDIGQMPQTFIPSGPPRPAIDFRRTSISKIVMRDQQQHSRIPQASTHYQTGKLLQLNRIPSMSSQGVHVIGVETGAISGGKPSFIDSQNVTSGPALWVDKVANTEYYKKFSFQSVNHLIRSRALPLDPTCRTMSKAEQQGIMNRYNNRQLYDYFMYIFQTENHHDAASPPVVQAQNTQSKTFLDPTLQSFHTRNTPQGQESSLQKSIIETQDYSDQSAHIPLQELNPFTQSSLQFQSPSNNVFHANSKQGSSGSFQNMSRQGTPAMNVIDQQPSITSFSALNMKNEKAQIKQIPSNQNLLNGIPRNMKDSSRYKSSTILTPEIQKIGGRPPLPSNTFTYNAFSSAARAQKVPMMSSFSTNNLPQVTSQLTNSASPMTMSQKYSVLKQQHGMSPSEVQQKHDLKSVQKISAFSTPEQLAAAIAARQITNQEAIELAKKMEKRTSLIQSQTSGSPQIFSLFQNRLQEKQAINDELNSMQEAPIAPQAAPEPKIDEIADQLGVLKPIVEISSTTPSQSGSKQTEGGSNNLMKALLSKPSLMQKKLGRFNAKGIISQEIPEQKVELSSALKPKLFKFGSTEEAGPKKRSIEEVLKAVGTSLNKVNQQQESNQKVISESLLSTDKSKGSANQSALISVMGSIAQPQQPDSFMESNNVSGIKSQGGLGSLNTSVNKGAMLSPFQGGNDTIARKESGAKRENSGQFFYQSIVEEVDEPPSEHRQLSGDSFQQVHRLSPGQPEVQALQVEKVSSSPGTFITSTSGMTSSVSKTETSNTSGAHHQKANSVAHQPISSLSPEINKYAIQKSIDSNKVSRNHNARKSKRSSNSKDHGHEHAAPNSTRRALLKASHILQDTSITREEKIEMVLNQPNITTSEAVLLKNKFKADDMAELRKAEKEALLQEIRARKEEEQRKVKEEHDKFENERQQTMKREQIEKEIRDFEAQRAIDKLPKLGRAVHQVSAK